MRHEAAHADGHIVGHLQRVRAAAVIEDRSRPDEDAPADFDMPGEAGLRPDLGKVTDLIIVPDNTVGVDDTALAQLSVRADIGEGSDEGAPAQVRTIADDRARCDNTGEIQVWVIFVESAPMPVVANRDNTVPIVECGRIPFGFAECLQLI